MLKGISTYEELEALVVRAESENKFLYAKGSGAAIEAIHPATNPAKVRLLCDDGKPARQSTIDRLYVNYEFR